MNKLKTRAQFEAALKSEVVARSDHFALHRLPRPSAALLFEALPPGPSFAVLVPKRWATRAVSRNMIKRQARAIAQHALGVQDDAIFLLRLRKAWSRQTFNAASSPAWAREVRQQVSAIFSSFGPRPS